MVFIRVCFVLYKLVTRGCGMGKKPEEESLKKKEVARE